MDSHMQKNENKPLCYTTHKSYTKWIKDFNVRPETIILLEENKGGKLLEVSLGDDFLNLTPKAKITKWDITYRSNRKASAQQRKWSTEWRGNLPDGRKYLQFISDKGLVYKMDKELIKLIAYIYLIQNC